MLPTKNRCGFNRPAPARGHGCNPAGSLLTKSHSRGCGCRELKVAIDTLTVDVFAKFSACKCARGANAKHNRAPFSAFGSVNPISPICRGCWVPLLCVTLLKHVPLLTCSAVQGWTPFPPYRFRCGNELRLVRAGLQLHAVPQACDRRNWEGVGLEISKIQLYRKSGFRKTNWTGRAQTDCRVQQARTAQMAKTEKILPSPGRRDRKVSPGHKAKKANAAT